MSAEFRTRLNAQRMAIRPDPLAVTPMGRVLATPIGPSESMMAVPKLERNIESESAR